MDIPDYKAKYGEPKTLEEILMYCAFVLGQGGLEHRTLHHFDYFVSSLIFGKTHYEDFKRAYPEPVKEEEGMKHFAYTAAKGSVEDGLKIYRKYNPLYDNHTKNPLLKYAVAFMQYCEEEYGKDEGI
ncbi:hypothetical protein CCP3SC15_420004 [Gammaproteobacteria bacterium]